LYGVDEHRGRRPQNAPCRQSRHRVRNAALRHDRAAGAAARLGAGVPVLAALRRTGRYPLSHLFRQSRRSTGAVRPRGAGAMGRAVHRHRPRLAGPRHGPRRHAGELSMGEFALLLRYVRNGLRAQMLYPTVFLLFARFGHIKGWSFPEVALFYGIVSTAFSLCDMSARGFEMLGPQFIKTGDFDRILLRPRSATVQLAGFEFGFTTLGRLAQGLFATTVALALLPTAWSIAGAALLLWAITGGFAL